jgi:hypothetical protein
MKIMGFGQMVNVSAQKMVHQLVVMSADGQQHVVDTDEATVKQLAAVMANMPPQSYQGPQQSEPVLAPEYQEPESGLEAEVFGDEVDPGEASSEPVMGVIAEDRIADVPDEPTGLGQPRPAPRKEVPKPRRVVTDKDGFVLPVPSKTVPKDEMGYPLVAKKSAPKIPEDGGEEDGAQI